jgi:hypothetical protein
LRLFLPGGTYLINVPLTKNATGFKFFGESEGNTILKADAGFTGSYMLDLGDGITSRFFNEIRHISFNGNSVASIVALYLNRVNNQSKVMHCQFQNCGTGLKAENLALANVLCYCKFGDGTNVKDVELVSTAGNSWLIFGNYFTNAGYFHMNDSMTDVKIVQNVWDGGGYILGDGGNGQRGCQIVGNRMEVRGETALQLGLQRSMTINDNYFTGSSGQSATAIEISSSEPLQSGTISNNRFEEFSGTDIVFNANVPGDKWSLVDNNYDDAATFYDGPMAKTEIVNSLKTHDGDLTIQDQIVSYGSSAGYVTSYFVKRTVITGSAQDLVSITVPATEEGGYSIAFEGFVGHSATPESETASIGFKKAVSVTHSGTGTPAFGAVSDIYLTDSAATTSGTRDIASVALTTVNTSDTVATLQLNVGVTGSGSVQIVGEIKIFWEGYSTKPVVAQV